MDRYLYLLLSLYVLGLWLIIFARRPDLRKKMWRTSIMGLIAGPLAEFWYFRDYWRPMTWIGPGKIFIEDFIVGFAIVGVSATIYDAIAGTEMTQGSRRRIAESIGMFSVSLILLILLPWQLGWNTAFVSMALFFLCAMDMWILRRDLIIPSLASGILLTIIMFPAYVILFTWLSPDYWDQYWLLKGTGWDITIRGVPGSEMLWYFTWGCLGGIGYEFTLGKYKKPLL